MKNKLLLLFVLVSFASSAQNTPWQGKFEQLGTTLPTPNEYRTASGAPGPKYWQQKADYVINVELNDDNQSITGSETITYTNNSPSTLKYLWLQLDQNKLAKDNNSDKTENSYVEDSLSARGIAGSLSLYEFDGGYKIKSIKDAAGKALTHYINYTMMRVDLPQPLAPNQKFVFSIEWSYNINNGLTARERTQYEYFEEDKNYLYVIAQWYPRMCVYDDVNGWQNKQFLGQGEFALAFGDYKVKITVPADHILGATGALKNAEQVLTKEQLARYEKAKNTFDKPVIIATQEEAIVREKTKLKEKKTWEFQADNVRDFAFATSRKFIWDAMAVKLGEKKPLAMSFYPKEGNPLWEKESTIAVKNTLEVYSRMTLDYPYPQATSVHAAHQGMEYPMICFNYGRPLKDGTVPPRVLKGMLGVIIHEVGHNFFPMIINNDERQWTWMDEGINSFVENVTEFERYPNIDWSNDKPEGLVPYMKGDKEMQRPLMTNSEQVLMFGAEQYAKAATGLYMLRETIMGRDLFDRSFKEYAQRWAFKHPQPADFFRTMEDASAVDLDWFWKGWFYTTDHVDQSVDDVKWFKVKTDQKDVENKSVSAKSGDLTKGASATNDFSKGPEFITVLPTDDRAFGEFRSKIDDKVIMDKLKDKNLYEVKLSNKGGLVMPVIIEWTYKDGSKEIENIPAEIWRTNEKEVTKVFVKQKEVVSVVIDPMKELTDISKDDNVFPRVQAPSKVDALKKN